MATVGTTASLLHDGGSEQIVVRNLGPGNVGLGKTNAVTVANAEIYLQPGDSFEWISDLEVTGWDTVYAIADAAGTDVRVAVVG